MIMTSTYWFMYVTKCLISMTRGLPSTWSIDRFSNQYIFKNCIITSKGDSPDSKISPFIFFVYLTATNPWTDKSAVQMRFYKTFLVKGQYLGIIAKRLETAVVFYMNCHCETTNSGEKHHFHVQVWKLNQWSSGPSRMPTHSWQNGSIRWLKTS